MEKRMGMALWGCGRWGEKWLATLLGNDAVDLVYVMDSDRARLEQLKLKYPSLTVTNDIGKTLLDERVQAVVIAAPVKDHARLTEQALNANRHVLCEKPLCHVLDELIQINQAAKKSRGRLMVGHLLAFYPLLSKLRQMLRSGDLGELHGLELRRTALGRVRRVEDVIKSFAVHDLVAALLLLDAPITAVDAYGWGLSAERVEEGHIVLKSGAVTVHIYANWLSPYKERRMLVTCENGSAEFWEDGEGTHLRVWKFAWSQPAKGEDTIPVEVESILAEDLKIAALELELEGFLRLIQTGEATAGTVLEFTGLLMTLLDEIDKKIRI
jgi:predicted dehydrogenase